MDKVPEQVVYDLIFAKKEEEEDYNKCTSIYVGEWVNFWCQNFSEISVSDKRWDSLNLCGNFSQIYIVISTTMWTRK